MIATYDILLKNGWVVDPLNQIDHPMDIAVAQGKIVKIDKHINSDQAQQVFDLKDRLIVPGVIDSHVHASFDFGGKYAHRMLAKAGVVTALDMAGPIQSLLKTSKEYGAGLNLACAHFVWPGHTVKTNNPGREELEDLLHTVMGQGAIGLKIMGGHYPISPEACARTIEVCAQNQGYAAFHAGSLISRSSLEGMIEAVELSQGHRLHLAHINSYCRGLTASNIEEACHAITLLKNNSHIYSESYLSPLNGTSGKCIDGILESKVTKIALQTKGFEPNEKGLYQAITQGDAFVIKEAGGEMILTSGHDAVQHWQKMATDTLLSFVANPPEARYLLAVARQPDNDFVVDALSTDGGGLPRNVLVEMGLALVDLQAWTMRDFVIKTSINPAKMLALKQKGHLGEGADADITVLQRAPNRPVMSIAMGQVIMHNGYVCGEKATIITTDKGAKAVDSYGLRSYIVQPEDFMPAR